MARAAPGTKWIAGELVTAYVRRLTSADCGWAAEMMERRREIYAAYSPVFWRPAVGVTGMHARFLAKKASSNATVAVRTDHGFLIAELRNSEGFIDDFAVEPDARWAADGAALLRAAWPALAHAGATRLRVVSAAADAPKVAMLEACSLELVAQWWVKPLDPTGAPGASGRVTGPGFSGILSPAPPVYDPGGPVLLAERVEAGADLARITETAAAMGAVLAVVPTPAGGHREAELRTSGWTVSSAWYLGAPGPAR